MASKYEDSLALQLTESGIEFIREYKFHPHRQWKCDFYLKKHNLVIEVEGISYRGQGGRHQSGKGFQADCVKYNNLALMGYRLLRFTPAMVTGKARSPLKNVDREDSAMDVIKRFINEQSTGTGD